MRNHFATGLLLGALFASIARIGLADRNVLTFHYDNQRTGWNSQETALRPDNISSDTFGKLWYVPLDGQVYAAPLVLTGAGVGAKDMIFVATENNSVYALNGDTGEILWTNHLAPALTQNQFEATIGIGSCPNINPLHGITGTPVLDETTNTLYAVALTEQGANQNYKFFALDALTGAVKDGWPVTIQGQYKNQTFVASQLTQRAALTLLNGTVYAEFSSRCDIGEWHGWVIGVKADSTRALSAFSPDPASYGGGIWGSAGASVDADGNFYVVTGNGDYDLAQGGDDAGQSVLRLAPQGDSLAFSEKSQDCFTLSTYLQANQTDQDLGGSSALVLPDHAGSATPHLLITGGKDGVVYLLDRDNLGGVGGQIDEKSIYSTGGGALITTTPATFVDSGGNLYVYVTDSRYGQPMTDPIKGLAAYQITANPTTSKSQLTYLWTNAKAMLFAGTPVVTSDGNKNGVLWVTDAAKTAQHTDTGGDAVLYAFDAITGKELYDSNQLKSRDDPGEGRKFTAPTVANGKVYATAAGSGSQKTHGVAAFGFLLPKGDANLDGVVDIQDATLALRSAVGLTTLLPQQANWADMNGDGTIDLRDVVLILRKSLGLG